VHQIRFRLGLRPREKKRKGGKKKGSGRKKRKKTKVKKKRRKKEGREAPPIYISVHTTACTVKTGPPIG